MLNRAMLAATGASALLCACGGPQPARAPAPPATAAQPDYVAPPELTGAVRSGPTTVQLSGEGPPDAVVRLASPDGSAIGAQASREGRWTVPASSGPEPRLYSLSEDLAGRLLRARGYIAVLPQPGPPAVVLRPGGGAQPVGSGRGLTIDAVDFDRSSAAVVSGRAEPYDTVRLSLDGSDAGEDRADRRGVYVIPMSKALRAGAHQLTIQAGRRQASAAFAAGPAEPIRIPPMSAQRLDGAWRIDWMTPSGGVQSSIVFDSGEAVR